ncbi:hypothetical protein R50071_44950 [Halioxenophilus aromaticivorans]
MRWGFIALFAAREISAILTVATAIKAAIDQHQDPDEACEQRIKAVVPDNKLANLLLFESRVWMFFLLGRRISPNQYRGIHHFSYHHKDGAASNAFGWIMVILFEAPLLHLLLHFIWSATAANVVTGLTLLSLVFFVADYQAMRKRPISLTKNTLIVRYGLRAAFTVPLADIESIEPLPLQSKSSQNKPSAQYGRNQNLKADLNYSYHGSPNLLITLHRPIGKVSSITLGMDRPGSLISQINQAESPTHNPEAD